MIKTSALLVLVAIGLLVAGVLASSLLMVYVSIGVCAAAALLLAVGVLSHWSEIFGRREPRPSGMPESWSAPQMQVSAPVLASAQAAGPQVQGAQGAGTRAPGPPAREDRRSRRGAATGRPTAHPVEVVTPQAEFAVPGPGDDLWERVEEELGSPGKRDTGALSWPATEVPVLGEPADEPEEARPPGVPPAGSSAWVWGQGAGWQPPETPDDAWPPPAAAFAGSPPARPEPATADTDGSAAGEHVDRSDQETPRPEPKSEAPAGPARAADEAAPESVGEVSEQDPEAAPAKRDTWDERPRWIISVGDAAPARPVPDNAVSVPPSEGTATAAEPAAGQPAAGKPEAAETKAPEAKAAETKGAESKGAQPEATRPAVAVPAGQEAPAKALAGQEPASREPAVDVPPAEEPPAEQPPAEQPAAKEPVAEEPADAEPAADGPAEKPAPGRIEVTVVPGVARYHRSGCILIRFLGAGDLEIMTRQEADEAKFAACRACQPDLLEA